MNAKIPTTIPALEVRRRVSAPPQVVFDYWTDPEQVRYWLGGPAIKVSSIWESARPTRKAGEAASTP